MITARVKVTIETHGGIPKPVFNLETTEPESQVTRCQTLGSRIAYSTQLVQPTSFAAVILIFLRVPCIFPGRICFAWSDILELISSIVPPSKSATVFAVVTGRRTRHFEQCNSL